MNRDKKYAISETCGFFLVQLRAFVVNPHWDFQIPI